MSAISRFCSQIVESLQQSQLQLRPVLHAMSDDLIIPRNLAIPLYFFTVCSIIGWRLFYILFLMKVVSVPWTESGLREWIHCEMLQLVALHYGKIKQTLLYIVLQRRLLYQPIHVVLCPVHGVGSLSGECANEIVKTEGFNIMLILMICCQFVVELHEPLHGFLRRFLS